MKNGVRATAGVVRRTSSVALLALGALVASAFGCEQLIGLDNEYMSGDASFGAGGAPSASSAQQGSVGSGGGAGTGSAASSSSVTGVGGATGAGGGGSSTYEWTATDPGSVSSPCEKTYLYNLPDWLVFSSPTPTERTSQIAVDKLCRNYTQDVPRARNVGNGWGLSVESARTNLVKNSDSWSGTGWGAGTMQTTLSLPDPAGGVKATEFTSPGDATGSYSAYTYPAVSGQVASSWLRGSSGAAPYAHFRHVIDGPWQDVTLPEWRRISVAQETNTLGDMALETRNRPEGAGVITKPTKTQVFGAQIESGAHYPSSYIPTAAGTVNRLAESLRTSNGMMAALAPGGYFSVTLKLAPSFEMSDAKNEMSAAEYNLLYFDNKNRLFLRKLDRKMVLRIDNKDTDTPSLTFSREQELTILATNEMDQGFHLKVTGATDGNGNQSGSPEVAVSVGPASVVYILGGNQGAEECADLRYIHFGAKTD